MQALLSAVLYLAVAVVFLRGWVLSGAGNPADPSAGDLLSQYYPLFRYGFTELSAGRIPLWDPHQLAGVPFLAYPVASFVYPLYAPFLVLRTETAMNLDLIVHLTLCGASTFLLCRALGVSAAGAAIGGLVYVFQGGMMIKLYYPGYLASVAWVPLFFLFTYRLIERPAIAPALALALAFGLSLLGGHGVQFHYFAALGLTPFVLTLVAQRALAGGARDVAKGLALMLFGFALGALLASIRLIPAAEVARLSWRPPGALSFEDAATMSVDPSIFLNNLLSPATVLGPLMAPKFGAIMREGYVGIVPLVLALVGAFLWRERRFAVPFATMMVAAVLYAFGANGFLFRALYHLPGGGWFRGPDRMLFIFGLCVAVLAAAGFDQIAARRRGWIAGLIASAVVLAAAAQRGTAGHALSMVALYCGVAAAAALVVGFARGSTAARTVAALALGAAVALDLWNGFPFGGALPSQLGPYFARHAELFRQIRERQGLQRTYIWASFKGSDPLYFFSDIAKAGLFHRVYLPTDYEGLVQDRLERYLRFETRGKLRERGTLAPIGYYPVHLTPANLPLFNLLGVRFFVLQDGTEKRYIDPALNVGERWQVLRKADGVTVYENPDAMPRVFIAPRVEVIADPGTVLDRLSTANLRDVALVEEPIELPHRAVEASPLDARVTDYRANRVEIEASSPEGGLLVLTDQHFPGWTASLDGDRVAIVRADYLFRGIALPAGRHRVELVYRPASIVFGLIGTGLALLVIVVGAAVSARSRTRTATR